ncbi:MAG TPA: alkyl sulfatase C-terminal domain-containing protein [Streptosporangiaceae bacterium]
MPRGHNKQWLTGPDDDFADSCRGYIGPLSPAVLRETRGSVSAVGQVPWRQSQLAATPGLFEVIPGIYQVRGNNQANMTLVEGSEGVIVIDPLISAEYAAAAVALYRAHRGERPVTGVVYASHFAGVRGVTSGDVPVFAAGEFLEQVALGGLHGTSRDGTIGLVPPDFEIAATGQEEKADGVRMNFQLAPDAGVNVFFPDLAALCVACPVSGGYLRGWARCLTEAVSLFADRTDVVSAAQHWPAWGRDHVLAFLSSRRDMYAYLHDQTIRQMNRGSGQWLTLPPGLEEQYQRSFANTGGRETGPASADIVAALSTRQLFDALAVQLDGPRAARVRLVIGWELTDLGESWTLLLANGVLTPVAGAAPGCSPPDLAVSLARPVLDALIAGRARLQDEVAAGRIAIAGDAGALTMLLSLLS